MKNAHRKLITKGFPFVNLLQIDNKAVKKKQIEKPSISDSIRVMYESKGTIWSLNNLYAPEVAG